uniref:Glutathione S-transferase kappa 1 n=1 Tax=Sinocyclocheilus rhinocerous TaxID=307959 RepID=A0A673KE23_9TELE
MSNSRKVVKLYYDVISTYSWLAFEVLCCYRNVWNIDLKFKPAFLGGVFHGSGNQKPGLVQNKFCYMVTDLKQLSEFFGVRVNPPLPCKKGTLNVMRFVTAVDEKEKERGVLVERVSRELWKNIWCTHQDITHPATLTEAGLKAGLSANEVEELLILSKSQQIKDNAFHLSTRIVMVILRSHRSIVIFITYDLFRPHSDRHYGLNRMTYTKRVVRNRRIRFS